MHNLNPDPTVIDEPSLLQVKLEVAGVKKAGPRRLVRRMSPRTSELEKNDYLEQNRFLEDTIENNQHMDSFLVKQEPCTSRGLHLEPPEDSSESEFNDTSTGHQSDAHCNQLFNDPSHLALPLLSHLTLFACKVCGKSFKRQNKLRTHMALHRNEQNHVCHVCEKSFVSISVLNVHLMSHTNERRFGCSFCDKRFKLKSHLKEHERIHTGERPFSCPVCRRSFSRSNSMKNHFRNSHREHFQSEEPQLSDIWVYVTQAFGEWHWSEVNNKKTTFTFRVGGYWTCL